MKLEGLEEDHSPGVCGACWQGFPRACACGGEIHAEFAEEHWDGYDLRQRCTRCGADYIETNS